MEVKEILRERPDFRIGYMPTSISLTTFDPDGVLRKLRIVPHKITANFRRDKIKEVFKSDYTRDPRDNYYIIRATDGTLFHVDY